MRPLLLGLAVGLFLAASVPGQTGYAEAERLYRESSRPLEALDRKLKEEAGNPWLLDFLALADRDRGEFDSAIARSEAALRLDPDQAWHRKIQGEILMAAGRPAEAALAFRAAVERETREEVRFALFQQQTAAELAARQRQGQEEEMASFAGKLTVLGTLALLLSAAAVVLALRR